jgi:hypothetical protein
MLNEIDCWFVISLILIFIVGYLATENYKLRKIKKEYLHFARDAVNRQKMACNFNKPKIKDIN